MASDTELEHAVLIAEYNQKQETFRTHMRLFGQLVITYLAIMLIDLAHTRLLHQLTICHCTR